METPDEPIGLINEVAEKIRSRAFDTNVINANISGLKAPTPELDTGLDVGGINDRINNLSDPDPVIFRPGDDDNDPVLSTGPFAGIDLGSQGEEERQNKDIVNNTIIPDISDIPDDPEDRAGFFSTFGLNESGGITNEARRGVLSMRRDNALNELDKIFKQEDRMNELSSEGGDVFVPAGDVRAFDEEAKGELIDKVVKLTSEIEGIPISEALQNFQNPDSIKELISVAINQPSSLLESNVSSLISSIPTFIGATIGKKMGGPWGMAIGTAIGTMSSEKKSAFAQFLQEEGVDLTDPTSLTTMLENPEKREELQSKAQRKGLGTAVVEGLFGFGLGKVIDSSTLGSVGKGVAGTVNEALGEGIGGQAGNLLAGEEASLLEATQEMLSAGSQGAAQQSLSALTEKIDQIAKRREENKQEQTVVEKNEQLQPTGQEGTADQETTTEVVVEPTEVQKKINDIRETFDVEEAIGPETVEEVEEETFLETVEDPLIKSHIRGKDVLVQYDDEGNPSSLRVFETDGEFVDVGDGTLAQNFIDVFGSDTRIVSEVDGETNVDNVEGLQNDVNEFITEVLENNGSTVEQSVFDVFDDNTENVFNRLVEDKPVDIVDVQNAKDQVLRGLEIANTIEDRVARNRLMSELFSLSEELDGATLSTPQDISNEQSDILVNDLTEQINEQFKDNPGLNNFFDETFDDVSTEILDKIENGDTVSNEELDIVNNVVENTLNDINGLPGEFSEPLESLLNNIKGQIDVRREQLNGVSEGEITGETPNEDGNAGTDTERTDGQDRDGEPEGEIEGGGVAERGGTVGQSTESQVGEEVEGSSKRIVNDVSQAVGRDSNISVNRNGSTVTTNPKIKQDRALTTTPTVEEVQNVVNDVLPELNIPTGRVQITVLPSITVSSTVGVDPSNLIYVDKSGKALSPSAVFIAEDNRVVLFADMIDGNNIKNEVQELVAEEVVTHYGLRELLGKDFETTLSNYFDITDPAILKNIITKYLNQLTPTNGSLVNVNGIINGKIELDNESKLLVMEEYFGELATKSFEQLKPSERNFLQRILDDIKVFLNKIGLNNVGTTQQEIRNLLYLSAENLRNSVNENVVKDATVRLRVATEKDNKLYNIVKSFNNVVLPVERTALQSGEIPSRLANAIQSGGEILSPENVLKTLSLFRRLNSELVVVDNVVDVNKPSGKVDEEVVNETIDTVNQTRDVTLSSLGDSIPTKGEKTGDAILNVQDEVVNTVLSTRKDSVVGDKLPSTDKTEKVKYNKTRPTFSSVVSSKSPRYGVVKSEITKQQVSNMKFTEPEVDFVGTEEGVVVIDWRPVGYEVFQDATPEKVLEVSDIVRSGINTNDNGLLTTLQKLYGTVVNKYGRPGIRFINGLTYNSSSTPNITGEQANEILRRFVLGDLDVELKSFSDYQKYVVLTQRVGNNVSLLNSLNERLTELNDLKQQQAAKPKDKGLEQKIRDLTDESSSIGGFLNVIEQIKEENNVVNTMLRDRLITNPTIVNPDGSYGGLLIPGEMDYTTKVSAMESLVMMYEDSGDGRSPHTSLEDRWVARGIQRMMGNTLLHPLVEKDITVEESQVLGEVVERVAKDLSTPDRVYTPNDVRGLIGTWEVLNWNREQLVNYNKPEGNGFELGVNLWSELGANPFLQNFTTYVGGIGVKTSSVQLEVNNNNVDEIVSDVIVLSETLGHDAVVLTTHDPNVSTPTDRPGFSIDFGSPVPMDNMGELLGVLNNKFPGFSLQTENSEVVGITYVDTPELNNALVEQTDSYKLNKLNEIIQQYESLTELMEKLNLPVVRFAPELVSTQVIDNTNKTNVKNEKVRKLTQNNEGVVENDGNGKPFFETETKSNDDNVNEKTRSKIKSKDYRGFVADVLSQLKIKTKGVSQFTQTNVKGFYERMSELGAEPSVTNDNTEEWYVGNVLVGKRGQGTTPPQLLKGDVVGRIDRHGKALGINIPGDIKDVKRELVNVASNYGLKVKFDINTSSEVGSFTGSVITVNVPNTTNVPNQKRGMLLGVSKLISERNVEPHPNPVITQSRILSKQREVLTEMGVDIKDRPWSIYRNEQLVRSLFDNVGVPEKLVDIVGNFSKTTGVKNFENVVSEMYNEYNTGKPTKKTLRFNRKERGVNNVLWVDSSGRERRVVKEDLGLNDVDVVSLKPRKEGVSFYNVINDLIPTNSRVLHVDGAGTEGINVLTRRGDITVHEYDEVGGMLNIVDDSNIVDVESTINDEVVSTYDFIINNNGLSYRTQQHNDEIVDVIGKRLNVGGTAIIKVRRWKGDVDRSKGEGLGYGVKILPDDTYVKGWDSDELLVYVNDILGEGFTTNLTPLSGGFAVVINKTKESTIDDNTDVKTLRFNKRYDPEELRNSIYGSSPRPEGRPDLANFGRSETERIIVDSVDNIRNEVGEPIMVDISSKKPVAVSRVNNDFDGEKNKLLNHGLTDLLEDQLVAQEILSRQFDSVDINDDSSLTDVMKTIDAVRNFRGDIARSLAAGYDPTLTPSERKNRMILNALFSPPALVRKKLDAVKNDSSLSPQERKKQTDSIWNEWQKDIKDVIHGLASYQIDVLNLTEQDLTRMDTLAFVMRTISSKNATLGDKIYEYWMNSILSAPTTHLANFAGNTANTFWEFGLQRPAEAIANELFGKKTNRATLGEVGQILKLVSKEGRDFFRSWLPTAMGKAPMGVMMKSAIRRANLAYRLERPILEAEVDEKVASKLDRGSRAAIGGKTGRIVRQPSRWLLWTDELLKSITFHLEASSLAYRAASEEGLTGIQRENRVAHILSNPHSEAFNDIFHNSYLKARNLAFQDPLETAFLKGLTKDQENKFVDNLLKFFIPFITTPTNILKQGFRKAPIIGALPILYKMGKDIRYQWNNNNTHLKYDAEQRFEEIVTQVMSSAMLFSLMFYIGDDDELPLITGSEANFRSDRGQLELQRRGVPPLSVRVGNRYYSYARIEPFATSLAIAVDALDEVRQVRQQGKNPAEALSRVMSTLTSLFRDKTFFQGLSTMMEFVEDPGRASEQFFPNFFSSFSPNIVRRGLGSVDQNVRDNKIRGESFEEHITEMGKRIIQKGLPGLIQPQPAKYDLWGREVVKTPEDSKVFGVIPPTPSRFLLDFMSPMRVTDADRVLPVDRMMMNFLWQNPELTEGNKPPLPPATYFTVRNKKIDLTDEEYQEYSRLSGEFSYNIIKRMKFDVENPTPRDMDKVKKAVRTGRSRAKSVVMKQMGKSGRLREALQRN